MIEKLQSTKTEKGKHRHRIILKMGKEQGCPLSTLAQHFTRKKHTRKKELERKKKNDVCSQATLWMPHGKS